MSKTDERTNTVWYNYMQQFPITAIKNITILWGTKQIYLAGLKVRYFWNQDWAFLGGNYSTNHTIQLNIIQQ